MRGISSLNYPAFTDAAERLRAKGWFVYSPHELDIEAGDDLGELPISEHGNIPFAVIRRVARRDMDVILNQLCGEDGDILVGLPDWRKSTGAQAEAAVGRWTGLPVHEIDTVLNTMEPNDEKEED
jgi:hypothetical protein